MQNRKLYNKKKNTGFEVELEGETCVKESEQSPPASSP